MVSSLYEFTPIEMLIFSKRKTMTLYSRHSLSLATLHTLISHGRFLKIKKSDVLALCKMQH